MWKYPECGGEFSDRNQSHQCESAKDDPAICSIDEYIQQAPEQRRQTLQSVRETIRAVAPDSTEKIAWGMPTFWQGENLVHFAAFKNHLGIFPGSEGVAHFSQRLEAEGYAHSKGTIQFPWSKPIPHSLIADIARYRLEEAQKKQEGKKAKKIKK